MISKQQVTDLPDPTGPMSARILALLDMNLSPVGGGV
jgi:hypothetical protein